MQLPPSAGGLAALARGQLPAAVVEWITGQAPGPHGLSAYLYDLTQVAANARRLREVLPDWAEVFYAVKANSFAPVLAALAVDVDGFEVSSITEIERASAVGARLVASGPGKTTALLQALVAAGVEVVNVESLGELHRLSEVAVRANRTVAVAVRVNPARVPLAGSLRMGGVPSAFGVPEADVEAVVTAALALPGVDVVGFHVHAVSHNLDVTAHLSYVRWCLDFAVRTAAATGLDLRVVDVGGGFGVPFEPDRLGEQPFDVVAFATGLRRLPVPAGVRVVFEPGRWLVADAGWYAAEVTDVKHSYGTDFAVLRGGIHHFQLPTSWEIVHNFAVVPTTSWHYDAPRPAVGPGPVTVVGELCTPEDTLARDVVVERVRAGDVVVFPMAGAYGYEFAMHDFLGHPLPTRVVLSDPSETASGSGGPMHA